MKKKRIKERENNFKLTFNQGIIGNPICVVSQSKFKNQFLASNFLKLSH